jgi:hypothetical protein
MSGNDKKEKSDTTQTTVRKTLWSETLIEILVDSLEKNQSDKKVKKILKELKLRKFKAKYITKKIRQAVGEMQANRVKKIIAKI